jgi:DNA-3-methyladenine glycosylase
MAILPQAQPPSDYDWLTQDVLTVAPALLGWELVTQLGGQETAGRIVELEAYHGTEDPASHAFRGPSPRTAPMFQCGGYIYTYRSYGIHTCMNIVTGQEGTAQAALIRAVEPTVGLEIMSARRRITNPLLLAAGPGRLTQALGITLADSGTVLGGRIWLRPPSRPIDPKAILTGPRIGISAAKDLPWRYYLSQNRFVSRR